MEKKPLVKLWEPNEIVILFFDLLWKILTIRTVQEQFSDIELWLPSNKCFPDWSVQQEIPSAENSLEIGKWKMWNWDRGHRTNATYRTGKFVVVHIFDKDLLLLWLIGYILFFAAHQ